MEKLNIGFALCGSFCTFDKAKACMKQLIGDGHELYPIMSEYAYKTDTRFGLAVEHRVEIQEICGREIIGSIQAAEPIGPKKLIDVLLVAPCTGNTLGKLAGGITDTAVTMAIKSQMRNGRPVVLALSTNDALGGSARNVGQLLGRKLVYFVPMGQDDAEYKPTSMVADFAKVPAAIEAAFDGRQLQPILL